MVDNRDGISYAETVDPPACNLPESGNWREQSRDPERKLNKNVRLCGCNKLKMFG